MVGATMGVFEVAVCPLIVTSLLALSCCVSGEESPYVTGAWSYLNYPNPRKDVNHCGRNGNASYVCDPNHVVTVEQANDLDRAIKYIMDTTKCPCSQYACDTNTGARPGGYRFALVLLKKMATVPRDAPGDARTNAAKDFAFHLYQNGWRTFGNCDELTIILYSEDDQILYFMTGNTARLAMDDNTVMDIMRQSSQVLQKQGVYYGLRDAIDRLGRAAAGKYRVGENGTPCLVSLMSLTVTTLLVHIL